MIKKIKNILFSIIYILITIYLAVFIPSFWGYKPLVVISGSMEPTLTVGGILYYHEQNIDDFKNGDILVFQTKDHIISHRIVDHSKTDFVTKGDANQTIDSNLVESKQILGKGTNWSIPLIGYYADFIYRNKYLLVGSLVILLIDLAYDLFQRYKRKEKQST